jgi:hypothetical protein
VNGIVLGIALIGGIVFAVSEAAKRGHRMPMGVCITAIVIGCILVAIPTACSFLLKLTGHEGRLSENESIPCWILGGILALVGMTASFFSRPSAAGSTKAEADSVKPK